MVIDDSSTDNTIEVVETFKDPIIKCIRLLKNSGAQVARNTGIKNALGKWIAFLDSDDEWLPHKLEKQLNILSKYNFDSSLVVHGDCYLSDYLKEHKSVWHVPLIKGEALKKLLQKPSPFFQSMLVAKEMLERIGYLDENVPSFQEWDTSIQLAKYCSFIHIREPLFIYHKHSGETISKDLIRDFRGYDYIIHKYENEIKRLCGIRCWNDHLKRQLFAAIECKLEEETANYLSLANLSNAEKQKIAFCKTMNFSLSERNEYRKRLPLLTRLIIDYRQENIVRPIIKMIRRKFSRIFN